MGMRHTCSGMFSMVTKNEHLTCFGVGIKSSFICLQYIFNLGNMEIFNISIMVGRMHKHLVNIGNWIFIFNHSHFPALFICSSFTNSKNFFACYLFLPSTKHAFIMLNFLLLIVWSIFSVGRNDYPSVC